ncbi:MAG: hypothetical protein ACTS5V_11965 [Giesbergeria sp.]
MKPGSPTFRALTALPALSALFVLLTMTSLPAHAIGRLADVTIVDRDTGATLPVHYAKGEYWVAGRPGARYAIAVRNRLGQRVMAVPSVDGVNVLTGETAAWDQRGYVFSPHERYQITGWRKSSNEIAAFEFSSAHNSYAGRTGRVANVGVIGVALFREEQPPPSVYPSVQRREMPSPDDRSDQTRDSADRLRDEAPASSAAPAPSAPEALSPRASGQSAEAAASRAPEAERQDSATLRGNLAKAAPAPTLGTAHGQRETSVVSQTTFNRLQAQPNEIISIRYDSRENLIAAGVIREPAPQLSPRAFPQSDALSYVPDPPRN